MFLRFSSLELTLENVLQLAAYGTVFFVLIYLTARSLKSAAIDAEGWRWIRPSFMHHFALVGSLAFSLLMWWVYLFVGSARADALDQENAMLLLAIVFGAGAIIVWWLYYAKRLCWRDDRIRIWTLGRFKEFGFNEIVRIKDVNGQGKWKISFEGGESIYVEDMSHGFDDLGEHLDRFIS